MIELDQHSTERTDILGLDFTRISFIGKCCLCTPLLYLKFGIQSSHVYNGYLKKCD